MQKSGLKIDALAPQFPCHWAIATEAFGSWALLMIMSTYMTLSWPQVRFGKSLCRLLWAQLWRHLVLLVLAMNLRGRMG